MRLISLLYVTMIWWNRPMSFVPLLIWIHQRKILMFSRIDANNLLDIFYEMLKSSSKFWLTVKSTYIKFSKNLAFLLYKSVPKYMNNILKITFPRTVLETLSNSRITTYFSFLAKVPILIYCKCYTAKMKLAYAWDFCDVVEKTSLCVQIIAHKLT